MNRIGGALTGEQHIHRRAQRVDVRSRIGAAGVLFGRRVARRRPARPNLRDLRREILRQAKIDQHHPVIRSDFDVTWFDVTVNDRAGNSSFGVDPAVHILQGIHHLADPGDYRGFGQRTLLLLGDLAQIIADHIVHHQVLKTGRFDKIVGNTRQVGMGEAGKYRSFMLKLLLDLRRGVTIFLDRHQPLGQVAIRRQIDRSHPATTQGLFDSITTLL